MSTGQQGLEQFVAGDKVGKEEVFCVWSLSLSLSLSLSHHQVVTPTRPSQNDTITSTIVAIARTSSIVDVHFGLGRLLSFSSYCVRSVQSDGKTPGRCQQT